MLQVNKLLIYQQKILIAKANINQVVLIGIGVDKKGLNPRLKGHGLKS